MRKRSLFVVFTILFVDLFGFGIVIPILPFYAMEYGASATVIGWLMASYSIMQFLFSPFWGKLSDRIGRRPVLLMSVLGAGAANFLMGAAGSLPGLFLGRLLGGACSGNISAAYAYITDVTDEKDRAKGMGLLGAAFGLGFTLGPAVGGLLSTYGHSMPMYAAGCIAILNFIAGWFFLKEPDRREPTTAPHEVLGRWEYLKTVLGEHKTGMPIFLYFVMTFAVTQVEVTFPIYMGSLYGFDARSIGVIMAITGVVMVVVQGGLIGRLARRFGERKLVIVGALTSCVMLGIFGFTTVVTWGVICLMGVSFGRALLHPSLSSLASMGANPSDRGRTMGTFQSSGSLARIFGPPLAGFLYDTVTPQTPFFSAAILMGVVMVISAMKLTSSAGSHT